MADGHYAKTINGDAYSQEIKDQTIEMIRRDWGKVDLVIYSIAAPRRKAQDGVTYRSVLKTVGEPYHNQTVNLMTNQIEDAVIEPANEQEIHDTIKVMGGEDWKLWMQALQKADVLSEGTRTVAYSYIGPELTYPIYYNGSIGQAKQDLYRTADEIQAEIPGIEAYVSVNKAVVTQSSAAIPIVPLYISILFRVMKEKDLHEGCIEQMYRLIHDRLCVQNVPLDEQRLIRVDDYEMKPEVQQAVEEIWSQINNDNLTELADLDGFWDGFYEIFGFRIDGVDYDREVDIQIPIPSLNES